VAGLALREMTAFLEDADVRRAVDQAGMILVERALEQLPPEA
jgi:hypothetical protein